MSQTMGEHQGGATPLSFGKLTLGVACGILLAMAILSAFYYFSVAVPRHRQAARDARLQLDASVAEMNREADRLRLQADQLQAKRGIAVRVATPKKELVLAPVPGMRYPECASRPTSMNLETCETALSPDRDDWLVDPKCVGMDHNSHSYRACVLKSLGS